ncbi:MAG: Flagellar hook-associated protein 1 [Planctomycetota bacterium]|jgi:flagellar hook-associated protein 1 FlgK
MSLNGALQVGRSAIMASQTAMQVAGNNMANASTPGFSRQGVRLATTIPQSWGNNQTIGTGLQVTRISRTVDTALQGRVRSALSDENGAAIDQRFLLAVESVRNELGDANLSSRLNAFFSSFSELANNPNDEALRSVVVQQASGLAGSIRDMRKDHVEIRTEIDRTLETAVRAADELLTQIADLNVQISRNELGGSVGPANELRDRRDALINEVAKYLPISTLEQPNGMIDVVVDSQPLVQGGLSRGVKVTADVVGGELTTRFRIKNDGALMSPNEGQIGALLRQRAETVEPAIESLDTLARELMFQVNKVHSQSQGQIGITSVTGLNRITDATEPLNNTELPFAMRNGAFELHVKSLATGLRTTVVVTVDPATATLTDLRNAINAAIPPGTAAASITADNTLRLDANSGYELSFANDTSGVLAAIGINSIFGGYDAKTIEINSQILNDPRLLAVARDHVPGSNGGALAIAALATSPIEALGGRSIRGFWTASTTELGVRAEAANNRAESTSLVRESLDSQIQALSGVSIDEESINMLAYQRQFQAAARFISAIDETIQQLLRL